MQQNKSPQSGTMRELAFPEAMAELDRVITENREKAGELCTRLSGFAAPSIPQSVNQAEIQKDIVPIIATIRGLSGSVRSSTEMLRDLLSRLEI